MIASIQGTILLKGEKFVVVETNEGLGYKVFASHETLVKIPEKNENVKLWIHHHTREDEESLYGFLNYAELVFFEKLIGISGIGPKGALGILSIASVDTIKKAIAAGDTSYLTRVSGIGRKIAEKIVIELKDKMAGRGVEVDTNELKEEADALEALVSLGYSKKEAQDALRQVPADIEGTDKKIKEVLKVMGRN